MTGVSREIHFHILAGQFHSLGTAVHGVYLLGTTPHGVHGKASGIAEHIQDRTPFSIFLQQGTVLALVDKKTCLLPFQPVDMEFQAILHGNIVLTLPVDPSILLP